MTGPGRFYFLLVINSNPCRFLFCLSLISSVVVRLLPRLSSFQEIVAIVSQTTSCDNTWYPVFSKQSIRCWYLMCKMLQNLLKSRVEEGFWSLVNSVFFLVRTLLHIQKVSMKCFLDVEVLINRSIRVR